VLSHDVEQLLVGHLPSVDGPKHLCCDVHGSSRATGVLGAAGLSLPSASSERRGTGLRVPRARPDPSLSFGMTERAAISGLRGAGRRGDDFSSGSPGLDAGKPPGGEVEQGDDHDPREVDDRHPWTHLRIGAWSTPPAPAYGLPYGRHPLRNPVGRSVSLV
jgi:hypothetical protein